MKTTVYRWAVLDTLIRQAHSTAEDLYEKEADLFETDRSRTFNDASSARGIKEELALILSRYEKKFEKARALLD